MAYEPVEHAGDLGRDSVEHIACGVVRPGAVQLAAVDVAAELLASAKFVEHGKLDGRGEVIGGNDRVESGGDFPGEPFRDVPDSGLGAPPQCPAAAHVRALPELVEERVAELVPDVIDAWWSGRAGFIS